MKQCPKCNASIIDTAKFCSKCGVNIKKYEEENAKDRFCPECGTAITDGDFCMECGFKIGAATTDATFGSTDSFGDDWLGDIESSTDAAVAKTRENDAQWQIKQAFAAFEYEEHADGTYTITGLKDKTALQYAVPSNVVAITDRAFEGCNAIKITLPEDLLQIGNCAFKGCFNLSNINLPTSLMIVGDEAFSGCAMLDIALPETVRKVGNNALVGTVQWEKAEKTRKEREAEEKRKAEEFRKVQEAKKAEKEAWRLVGNVVQFGNYYKNSSKIKEPIDWVVVQGESDKALLLSCQGIDFKKYNETDSDVTWESCTLRKWLNGAFLNAAFSAEEQNRILTAFVSADKNPELIEDEDPTTDTYDKIFLLGIRDMEELSRVGVSQACKSTRYALGKEGAEHECDHETGYCCWWLRSTGWSLSSASIVACSSYNKGNCREADEPLFVRPALWINLKD